MTRGTKVVVHLKGDSYDYAKEESIKGTYRGGGLEGGGGKLSRYPLPKKNPCQGKHREFGNFAKTQGNTGNLVCSSCKFPDSKGKINICRGKIQFFLKLDKSAKSVLCM